jgi:hypothetical protein
MSQEEFDKFVQTKELPDGFTNSDLLETSLDQVQKMYGPNGKYPNETSCLSYTALLLMAAMYSKLNDTEQEGGAPQ